MAIINSKQAIEINRHISDGIEQWADVCLDSEASGLAYWLNYTPKDLMNATYIFQHVMSNIGIKAGIINEEKAVELGQMLRKLIIAGTGIDPQIAASTLHQ